MDLKEEGENDKEESNTEADNLKTNINQTKLEEFCIKFNIPSFSFRHNDYGVILKKHRFVLLPLQLSYRKITSEETDIEELKDSIAQDVLEYLRNGKFNFLLLRELKNPEYLLDNYNIITTSNPEEIIRYCNKLLKRDSIIIGMDLKVDKDNSISISLCCDKECIIFKLGELMIEELFLLLNSNKIIKIVADINNIYAVLRKRDILPVSLEDVSYIASKEFGYRENTSLKIIAEWILNLDMNYKNELEKMDERIVFALDVVIIRYLYVRICSMEKETKEYLRLRWINNI